MKSDLQKYIDTIPAVADAARLNETFWLNGRQRAGGHKEIKEVNPEQIRDASERLLRFAPYLKKVRNWKRPMGSLNRNCVPFLPCRRGWRRLTKAGSRAG